MLTSDGIFLSFDYTQIFEKKRTNRTNDEDDEKINTRKRRKEEIEIKETFEYKTNIEYEEPETETEQEVESDEEIENSEHDSSSDFEETMKSSKVKKQTSNTNVKKNTKKMEEVKSCYNIDEMNNSLIEIGSKYKYNIIYADPPWHYQSGKSKFAGGARNHYNTIPLTDLKKLKVSEICDKDAYLIIWVTEKYMFELPSLAKSWGFEVVNIFKEWIKTHKNQIGGARIGMYTRKSTERCFLCKRGNPLKFKYSSAMIYDVTLEDPREHSRKPDSIRDDIDNMFMDVPRIELFAREANNPRWEVWGNETEKFGKHDTEISDIRINQFKLQKIMKEFKVSNLKVVHSETKKVVVFKTKKEVDAILMKKNKNHKKNISKSDNSDNLDE